MSSGDSDLRRLLEEPTTQTPQNPTGGPSAGHLRLEGYLLLSGDGCSGARPPGKAMEETMASLDPGPRGEGVIPQGRLGKGCLPRELRIKLFNEVVGLRRRGLTYREVINWVWRRHGVRLSKLLDPWITQPT